jgi:hypothetical protein
MGRDPPAINDLYAGPVRADPGLPGLVEYIAGGFTGIRWIRLPPMTGRRFDPPPCLVVYRHC